MTERVLHLVIREPQRAEHFTLQRCGHDDLPRSTLDKVAKARLRALLVEESAHG